MKRKRNIFPLMLLLTIANVLWVGAKESPILTIDDFESNRNINLIGGLSGSWEKDPSDKKEYCTAEFVKDARDGQRSSALKLKYKLTPQAYNGYYTKLNGTDVSPFTNLQFFIKGGVEFPSFFKIELKNHLNEVGSYMVSGIDKRWKKISIPLNKFRGISDFSRMAELVVVFEGSRLGHSSGEIYLDDLSFTASPKEYKKLLGAVQKRTAQKQKELKKLFEKAHAGGRHG